MPIEAIVGEDEMKATIISLSYIDPETDKIKLLYETQIEGFIDDNNVVVYIEYKDLSECES